MDFENNNVQVQEFLEKSLGQKVKSYDVSPGSNLGDGYASLHSAIKVEFLDGKICHYFLKSCPTNSTRQEMIKNFNPFFKEFKFYCEIIPEFMEFQKSVLNGKKPLEFSIPEIIDANAVNYLENPAAVTGKIEKFEDNYILMKDMRKEFGFIKQDNFHRVTYAEAQKIVLEIAKFHAVSWAYKKKHGIDSLAQKFPYWVPNFIDEAQMSTFEPMVANGREIFLKMVAEEFGEKSEVYLGAQEFLKDNSKSWTLACKMIQAKGIDEKEFEGELKNPMKPNMGDPIEDSWTVLTQYDIWINNMLFKYDGEGQVQNVCLLDFQFSHETCPTVELAFVLYLCGDYELRSKYWSKITKFYHETLMGFFEYLGVEPFPGFTLDNLKRRLHRARIYGILHAIWFNPIMFNDPREIKDMENYEGNDNFGDLVKAMVNETGFRPELKKASTEMAKEAYDLGIF